MQRSLKGRIWHASRSSVNGRYERSVKFYLVLSTCWCSPKVPHEALSRIRPRSFYTKGFCRPSSHRVVRHGG